METKAPLKGQVVPMWWLPVLGDPHLSKPQPFRETAQNSSYSSVGLSVIHKLGLRASVPPLKPPESKEHR